MVVKGVLNPLEDAPDDGFGALEPISSLGLGLELLFSEYRAMDRWVSRAITRNPGCCASCVAGSRLIRSP